MLGRFLKTMLCLLFTWLLMSHYAVTASTLVFEKTDITTIDPYVHQNTLVVLDIDDTIIRSQTTLGNPACYYKLRDYYVSLGLLPEKDIFHAMDMFDMLLQRHVNFTLVDERIRELINRYQDRGIVVIGLTSRSSILADVTSGILKGLSIRLGKNLPQYEAKISILDDALYDQGILYVGDYHKKSEVLDAFIRRFGLAAKGPAQIVFVDDKEKYVRDIESYADTNGYDYVGLYYTKEKLRQRQIDLRIAFEQINRLLVDSDHPFNADEFTSPITEVSVKHLLFISAPRNKKYLAFKGSITPDHLLNMNEAFSPLPGNSLIEINLVSY